MEVLEQLKKELNSGRNLQVVFYEFSQKLMNEYYLQIGDEKIELCEIEFYYYDENKHIDCSVHKNQKQKTTGNLYVHNKANWIGGIDITFGNDDYYGGILIRGIKYKDDFISGPANIRNFLIDLFYLEKNISYIKFQKYLDNLTIDFIQKNSNNEDIYISSRENINEKYEKFTYLLYRFIRADYFKKNKIPKKTEIRAIYKILFDKEIGEKTPTEINKIKLAETEKYHYLNQNIQTFKDNL